MTDVGAAGQMEGAAEQMEESEFDLKVYTDLGRGFYPWKQRANFGSELFVQVSGVFGVSEKIPQPGSHFPLFFPLSFLLCSLHRNGPLSCCLAE